MDGVELSVRGRGELMRICSLALSAALLLSACTTGKEHVKAYSGEERPASQLALLKPTSGIQIAFIDGEAQNIRVTREFGMMDYEIGLVPGIHRVTLNYYIGTAYSKASRSVEFNVEAGRKYLLKSGKDGLSWQPHVVDVTDNQECWSVGAELFYNGGRC